MGNKENTGVLKAGRGIARFLVALVKYFLLSVLLAAVYYAILALFVSTDSEKQMERENALYEQVFPQMLEDEALVSDVIEGLQAKDERIYKDIFYASAPSLDPVTETGFMAASDTIPDRNIIKYTTLKADALLGQAARIEELLSGAAAQYTAPKAELPPLLSPLGPISYVQVGASAGDRMNPFYKVVSKHDGLDVIASRGAPVFAPAKGRVSLVNRSSKGDGNVVEITHAQGYTTRYCHLGDIAVSQGQAVRAGARIAEVGMSGNSLVPHLHYEVRKDDVLQDPVHYFFASVTPYEYTNMLYMSVNTGQSLD